MAETQNDPLLPGYSFNAHLVTGLTPIDADGYLDFFIDRPLGMKGYILNLTVRGERVNLTITMSSLSAGREIFCFFRREKFITMATPSDAPAGMVSPVGLLPTRLLA